MINKINFDISFTPYTIDTYQTFTLESEEESIMYNLSEDSGKPILYDDIEWEYDNKGLVKALADTWVKLMNENIIDNVILGVELDGEPFSPREYNFTTDNCNTIFTIGSEALDAYINTNKEDFEKNHIRSYDGFMCFMEDPQIKLHYYLQNKTLSEYKEENYILDMYESLQLDEFIDYKTKNSSKAKTTGVNK